MKKYNLSFQREKNQTIILSGEIFMCKYDESFFRKKLNAKVSNVNL